MNGRWLVVRVAAVLLLCAASLTPPVLGGVTAEQLQTRVDELVAYVRASERGDGSFGEEAVDPIGKTALGILALRAAGTPADDPAIERGAQYLVKHSPAGRHGVYEMALKIMVLADLDPGTYRAQIVEGAGFLIKAQHPSGGWGYPSPKWTDNSNSQFALLGLNAAASAGVRIPREVWQNGRTYFRAGQRADGGWGYKVEGHESYGSMTTAGVASLHICDVWLHVDGGKCGVRRDQSRIRKGLMWLVRNFSVTRNPRKDMWKFYYLYGLERVGAILARRYIGRYDWYREGVDHLVGDPPDIVAGPSKRETAYLRACFMVLFLAKGNAPILIHKAEWKGSRGVNRYDIRFLVQYASRELDRPLDWQIIPLDAPLDQLMSAPILYISGRGKPEWTPGELKRLREYVDAGGFVLAEAVDGDATFDQAFRLALETVFPGESLVKLAKDHPVYGSHFDLPGDARRPLEAVMGPCWVSILYAPEGISCPWDVAQFEDANFRLGLNIIAYVTGLRKLEGKLTRPEFYVPAATDPEHRRGAFTMGQVVHAGDWRPHKIAWRKVLEQLSRKAAVDVYSRPLPIRLETESPFQAHILYITGVQELRLSEYEQAALKRYIERGGFIFAEAACGSLDFDRSFRRLVGAMFPGGGLQAMPMGHPLLESGEPLDKVAYSPGVLQRTPGMERPALEFLEWQGRAAVVYSKYDLSSAIDGHPCHKCPSILEPSAGRLAAKIVFYGLSG